MLRFTDMSRLVNLYRRFVTDDSGATMVEYAVIGGILAAAIIAWFSVFNDAMATMINYLSNVFLVAAK